MPSQTAIAAATFTNSIGVNTHLGYNAPGGQPDNAYADYGKVRQAISYLGIGQVRDSIANSAFLAAEQQLHQDTGVKFDLYLGTNSGVSYDQQVAWLRDNSGLLSYVEGPNEVDNYPVVDFSGGAAAEQAALAGDARSSIGVPVINVSVGNPGNLGPLGDLSGSTDFSNAHTYPAGGQQPAGWLPGWLAQSGQDAPGKPTVQTEAGYSTTPQDGNQGSVSPAVQAKETLNLLFDSFQQGVPTTYLYELLDEHADGGGNREDHFGLFNNDGSPKPAADAVHNLTSILQDSGGGNFTLGSLNVDIQGLPSDGHSLLTQTSDGTYDLAVWAEPQIWNSDSQSEVAAPTSNVTVDLGQSFASVSVYDPLTGSAPVQTFSDVSSVQLGLSDHPLIIQAKGAGAPASVGNTTPASTTTTATSATDGGTADSATGVSGQIYDISAGGGSQVISDFVPGTDALHLIGYGAAPTDGVTALADSNGGTTISLNDGASIVLAGVHNPVESQLFV